jgi:hypothetical protein
MYHFSFVEKVKYINNLAIRTVLYEYEAWSLTLREERRLKVFENRVLREFLALRWTR